MFITFFPMVVYVTQGLCVYLLRYVRYMPISQGQFAEEIVATYFLQAHITILLKRATFVNPLSHQDIISHIT